jgi:hypothetical protein
VKLFASARFTDALAARERDAATRTLRSAGANPTSWETAGDQSYALLELASDAALAAVREAVPDAEIAAPPHAVLRIVPEHRRHVGVLANALAGPGGFAGVVRCATLSDELVIEVDVRTTPLHLIVALIDVEIGARNRRIETVLPLGDDVLAACTGALLHEPDLGDAARVLETHLEPLLASGRS